MDEFLTPVSTTKVTRTPAGPQPLIQEQQILASKVEQTIIDSPDEVLKALKEDPDYKTVSEVLKYLASESDRKDGFNLIKPDPVSGNIAYQLINTSIPNYWQTLKEHKVQTKQLVRCLRNPCGIGVILSRLRLLIADSRQKKPVDQIRDASSQITDLLDILRGLLQDNWTLSFVWNDVQTFAKDATQSKMIWREFVLQVTSGKILSLSAEAEDVLKDRTPSRKAEWLSDGSEYAAWLGRNIAVLVKEGEESRDVASAVVEFGGKALSLGYASKSTCAAGHVCR